MTKDDEFETLTATVSEYLGGQAHANMTLLGVSPAILIKPEVVDEGTDDEDITFQVHLSLIGKGDAADILELIVRLLREGELVNDDD